MTDIRESILNKLRETENIYKVKIPLAIESGSRGWGFASIDSDKLTAVAKGVLIPSNRLAISSIVMMRML